MSVKAISWVWDQETDPISKFVLVALADVADDHGQCFPSVAWIVHKTGLSERCIQYHTRHLQGLGLLNIEARQRKNGSDTSNLYTLSMPKVAPRMGKTHAPPGETPCTPQFGVGDAPPYPLNHKHRSTAPESAPEMGVANAAPSGADVIPDSDSECNARAGETQINGAVAVKMGPSEAWGVAKEQLRRVVGMSEWCRLYRYTHGWDLSDGDIRLEAPSIQAAAEIYRKHRKEVDDALAEAAGQPVQWSIYKRPGAEIGL